MASPACLRCHSCFSILVSPAPRPAWMVVWLIASHTPDTSSTCARAATWAGGAGCVAHPPAATARANATDPANRIRIPPGETTSSVYTIKLAPGRSDAMLQTGKPATAQVSRMSIGGRAGGIEDHRAGFFPFGHPTREQRVQLALSVGQRVQFLPVAGVIAGQLRAHGGQLCLELAYIRLQRLHAPRQPALLAFALLVALARD